MIDLGDLPFNIKSSWGLFPLALVHGPVLSLKGDTFPNCYEMLVAWMAPAETGASDLSPKGTMQPLRRAVGKSAVGADSRPCDKSTFQLCTDRSENSGKGDMEGDCYVVFPLVARQRCFSNMGLHITD